MELEKLRDEIDEADRIMIDEIMKRFNLAKEIAEFKRAHNLQIRNLEREKKVLENWKNKFHSLGFEDDAFIEKLFHLIVREAIKVEMNDGKDKNKTN